MNSISQVLFSNVRFRLPIAVAIILSILVLSCVGQKEERLPILGEKHITATDTTYHTIGHFALVNQDSAVITEENLRGKIYVADFFFTSCRTICPVMKSQMRRVYETFKNDPEVMLVSHTIDPEYDTVALLKDYAERLDVDSDKWYFLTGNKDSIYYLAQTSYFVTAMEDEGDPDGFIHSGAFLLIDKKGRIRGKYDGTSDEEVDKLLLDIKNLEEQG